MENQATSKTARTQGRQVELFYQIREDSDDDNILYKCTQNRKHVELKWLPCEVGLQFLAAA